MGSAGPRVLPPGSRYPPGTVMGPSTAHGGTGRAGRACKELVPGAAVPRSWSLRVWQGSLARAAGQAAPGTRAEGAAAPFSAGTARGRALRRSPGLSRAGAGQCPGHAPLAASRELLQPCRSHLPLNQVRLRNRLARLTQSRAGAGKSSPHRQAAQLLAALPLQGPCRGLHCSPALAPGGSALQDTDCRMGLSCPAHRCQHSWPEVACSTAPQLLTRSPRGQDGCWWLHPAGSRQ